MKITNQIARFRKETKTSQAELAAAVGVTRQTIISLEGGKYIASLPLAYKIARNFGRTIEETFNLEGVFNNE
ncbi:MAG: helix-turn-helix transcriptional regulator [Clostridiales bacterium]|jgi:putative transcriptional regulator|nr:helix-turn-helix transcriptional regulator [Clostridiales bacterium]